MPMIEQRDTRSVAPLLAIASVAFLMSLSFQARALTVSVTIPNTGESAFPGSTLTGRVQLYSVPFAADGTLGSIFLPELTGTPSGADPAMVDIGSLGAGAAFHAEAEIPIPADGTLLTVFFLGNLQTAGGSLSAQVLAPGFQPQDSSTFYVVRLIGLGPLQAGGSYSAPIYTYSGTHWFQVSRVDVVAVPLPTAASLMASAFGLLGCAARKPHIS